MLKNERGKRVELAPMHREWHEFIRRCIDNGNHHIGILAPFRHGKTAQICIGYTLWAVAQNPNIRVKILCNIDKIAKDRVSAIKQYVEHDNDFNTINPNLKGTSDNWSKHSFTVTREAILADETVVAHGVSGSGTGGACDLLILDDICDMNNTMHDLERQRVADLINNVWLTRGEPGSVTLSISTAWHLEDIIHQMMKNPQFRFLIQRISEDMTGIEQVETTGHNFKFVQELFIENPTFKKIPLWESRWHTESLRERRIQIGSVAYERGYRQNAFTSTARTFQYFVNTLEPVRLPERTSEWKFFGGVDLSSSSRPGNIMVTVGVKETNRKIEKWFWNVIRYKGEMLGFITEVLNCYTKFHHSIVMIENNSMQGELIKLIQTKDRLNEQP